MTAVELAFDLIRRGNPTACKYAPRGVQADAVVDFMGRSAGYEIFISQAQYALLAKLMGRCSIIATGEDDERFACFTKIIFSEKKNKEYYLLCFTGFVPEVEVSAPVEAAPVVAAPVTSDRANSFASTLIRGAIEKGHDKADDKAAPGEDYRCCWLSKGQADALVALLPQGAIKADGNVITQVAGAFCWWSKVRMATTGSMLLCWMGEVSTPVVAAPVPVPVAKPVVPVAVIPAGKRIPMDADIPF